MIEDQNSMLQRATDSVNSGDFNEALEQARGILVIDSTNGDAKLIEAIALSHLGNSRDSSEAFAAAIRMSPTSVKARFNAAVHEFNVGNIGQSKILASEALSLDSDHEGTKTLIEKFGPEQPNSPGQGAYQRENASDFEPPYEGIPMVKSLGKGWMVIGALFSVASLIIMIWSAVQMFAHPTDVSTILNGGNNGQAMKTAMAGTNILLLVFDLVLRVLTIAWMIMDIIHRKGPFSWLIGHIPCSCLGLGFVTLPLYVFFGRK